MLSLLAVPAKDKINPSHQTSYHLSQLDLKPYIILTPTLLEVCIENNIRIPNFTTQYEFKCHPE